MSNKDIENLPVHACQITVSCSFDELCNRASLDSDFITACVLAGIVEIEQEETAAPQDWVFSMFAAQRIEKASRLRRDLDVELDSLGLILDLLEEVESLRAEATSLRSRLQHWEAAHHTDYEH